MIISKYERLVLEHFYRHPTESFSISEVCQHLQLIQAPELIIERYLIEQGLIYARMKLGQFSLRYSISDYGIYAYQQWFENEKQA